MEKYEVVKVGEPIELVRCGKHIAASDGKIYRKRGKAVGGIKEIKQTNNRGYLLFKFNGKMMRSHRFIAMCFIPNPNNLAEINHKNEIKTDNRVDNLEWCDRKYNCNYGTRNEKIGKWNKKKYVNRKDQSKMVLQYTKFGEFVAEYPSLHEVVRKFNFNRSNVSHCCHGRAKTAYGFVWRFAE